LQKACPALRPGFVEQLEGSFLPTIHPNSGIGFTDRDPAKGKKRSRPRNAPKFDLRTQLFKMCGVDLTRIDGIDVTTALAVISETGADMSRFPTDGHFASWMGLCPGTKITGGKVMSGKTKRCANRAARPCAWPLRR
jgi:transposase